MQKHRQHFAKSLQNICGSDPQFQPQLTHVSLALVIIYTEVVKIRENSDPGMLLFHVIILFGDVL